GTTWRRGRWLGGCFGCSTPDGVIEGTTCDRSPASPAESRAQRLTASSKEPLSSPVPDGFPVRGAQRLTASSKEPPVAEGEQSLASGGAQRLTASSKEPLRHRHRRHRDRLRVLNA